MKKEDKRIEYIDCLRCISILLVVSFHVSATILNVSEDTLSYNHYLSQIRMPLFFFISGFVFYKNDDYWNKGNSFSFIIKKFKVQIISTAIFFFALMYIEDIPFASGILSRHKNGYWFTITLFEFYLLYLALNFVSIKLKLKNKTKDIIIIATGLLLFIINNTVSSLDIAFHFILEMIGYPHWEYFTYFIFGTIVRKYFCKFEECIDTTKLIFASITVYFGLNIFQSSYTIPLLAENLLMLVYGYTGIVIIFSLFRKHQNILTKGPIGQTMQFIGKRTLDIYFIHFFFLPAFPIHNFTIFNENNIPMLEFCASLLISMPVIALCLTISSIIRLSPALSHILFGNKKHT